MTVRDFIAGLQAADRTQLGEAAPVYLFIDDQLYEVEVDVFEKGRLGPGSVLLMMKGKQHDAG